MSASTRAAGRGTIRKAAESPDESIMNKRFDHGLCVTCNAHLCEVTETGGLWKLNPMTTPGVVMKGRCLYCHPEHETHSVKEEEEQKCEDYAATVQVEEVETGGDNDDQSLPPVIALHGYKKRFVGVVSEGNTTKGKGIFHYVEETGEHKGKSIVYEGEFADGFFEGHGSLRDRGRGYVYEGEWKKSEQHGHFKETWKGKHIYEGEVKNDTMDGHGTLTWANGARCEGEWKNQMMNGNGKKIYKNGAIYEGNWKDGKRDGRGTLRDADGHVQVIGTWKNDKFVG
eukprot:scaffold34664_cov56-Attheya_sp.AAC.1